ncbi:hypothetical protein B0I72DRAFT_141431 [Yarrowia lipolytica]|jgi:hypothetical protein|uniref:C2H2-type domain-containing protein n=1 Tax=Yarrowia lipolytica TaxID=4952 RepID=A0A1D8N9N1_YARLL|nr:hypothetical protein YALI1_C05837g [Yarrowia lipolytica]KAB8283196.1 hypothetical protein BKA91DRAFT_137297 [Yarrowia lipolytica]KAE8173885.1 hypothetical protein BKA90DRAFT_134821 [Yarrowia lipolytica]KAJ8053054.1 hypothetical protein LXG23DRAFT_22485 [Yarrowia lipolytica]RDW24837.1 hypothetical protein B0I71DRAFT_133631 [Yarrowia lipolytica]
MKRSRDEDLEDTCRDFAPTPNTYPTTYTCSLHPDPISFASLEAFESHYSTSHTWTCTTCQARFPSEKFLNLHLDEEHDPFVAISRDRGDKYLACFEEGCDKRFAEYRKRRMHLVDKHGYPKNFRFGLVTKGLKEGEVSLLKQ